MTYRQKCHSLAKRFGATIEGGRSGNCWDYNITAPNGHIWKGDDIHCLVAFCYVGPREWTEEMWEDAFDRMKDGVEKCDIPDCDYCADNP